MNRFFLRKPLYSNIFNQLKGKRFFATNYTKDYYNVLGLTKTCSKKEIRGKYIELAKKWHPDSHANASESVKAQAKDKFTEIQEAYEILANESTRQDYDSVKFASQKTSTGSPYTKTGSDYTGSDHSYESARSRAQEQFKRGEHRTHGSEYRAEQQQGFTADDYKHYRKQRANRTSTAADYEEEMKDWKKKKMEEDRKYRDKEYSEQHAHPDQARLRALAKVARFGFWGSLGILFYYIITGGSERHEYRRQRRYARWDDMKRRRYEQFEEKSDEEFLFDLEKQAKAEQANEDMHRRLKEYDEKKFNTPVLVGDGEESYKSSSLLELEKQRKESIAQMIENSKRRQGITTQQVEKYEKMRNSPDANIRRGRAPDQQFGAQDNMKKIHGELRRRREEEAKKYKKFLTKKEPPRHNAFAQELISPLESGRHRTTMQKKVRGEYETAEQYENIQYEISEEQNRTAKFQPKHPHDFQQKYPMYNNTPLNAFYEEPEEEPNDYYQHGKIPTSDGPLHKRRRPPSSPENFPHPPRRRENENPTPPEQKAERANQPEV